MLFRSGRNRNNTRDDVVCLAVNVFWEEQEFYLPSLMYGMGWYVAVDTGNRYFTNAIPNQRERMPLLEGGKIRMVPRSVCVLVLK